MINTNYSNLERRFDSKRLSNNEETGKILKDNMPQNKSASEAANNMKDVAVTLTLNSQNGNSNGITSNVAPIARTAAARTTTLKVGSKGTAVKNLQTNLTKLGYSTKGTDGVFGNNTKNAVISFQKAYGLKADGIVGSQTQQKINQALDYQKKESLQ